jgi:hypothetical protein
MSCCERDKNTEYKHLTGWLIHHAPRRYEENMLYIYSPHNCSPSTHIREPPNPKPLSRPLFTLAVVAVVQLCFRQFLYLNEACQAVCSIKHIQITQISVEYINICKVRRIPSSGMLRRVALVRTGVSEELSPSIIRMTRIGELGRLAITIVRQFLSPWWCKR